MGPSWGYVGPSWSYIGPAWGLFWLILGLCWPILGQHARGGGPSLLRRGENRLRQCHGQGAPGRTTGSEAVATAVKLEVKTEPHPCALLGALMSSESSVMDKQDTLVYARALRVLAAQHTSLWSSQQAADTSVLWLCASQPQGGMGGCHNWDLRQNPTKYALTSTKVTLIPKLQLWCTHVHCVFWRRSTPLFGAVSRLRTHLCYGFVPVSPNQKLLSKSKLHLTSSTQSVLD